MAQEFSGTICFANGRAAANVRVRVFDKDVPGKDDDDLTLQEGLSDAAGHFVVRFAPSRFLDFREVTTREPRRLPFDWSLETRSRRLPDLTDIYLPYLQFDYIFNGYPRSHTAFLLPFKHEFRLPETPGVAFRPSLHGFKFTNRFPGYFLPFSIPALPDIPSVDKIYGLCGGMTAAAYDFCLAGYPIPVNTRVPKRASPLHQYIYRRQNDSLGFLGQQVVRFARWMALPDDTVHGVRKKSYDEVQKIRPLLDDGTLAPVGLVYVSTRDTLKIWENHQVLAYGYNDNEDGTLDVHVYDPNYPRRDDVVIHCEPVAVGSDMGFRSVQQIGKLTSKGVRGFFAMPYVPVEPPVAVVEGRF